MRSIVTMLALCTASLAGEFNKTLSIGDTAPGWHGLEGVDGRKHSLDDLKNKVVVVVVFTCNSCPVAADYEKRIIAFTEKHTGKDTKVALVAINVNTIKDDLLPKMKERAEKKKFNFPYLFDPTQEIAKKYGARFTPEFFVMDHARKIVYMGAMDDKSRESEVKEQFLQPAVEAALAGRPATTSETIGRGCRIRFNPSK